MDRWNHTGVLGSIQDLDETEKKGLDRQSDKIIGEKAFPPATSFFKKRWHQCNFGIFLAWQFSSSLSVSVWALAQLKLWIIWKQENESLWNVFLYLPVFGLSCSLSPHFSIHNRPLHRTRNCSWNGCRQVAISVGTSTISTSIPCFSSLGKKRNTMAIIYHSYT